MSTLIDLDSRRRTSLGKVGRKDHTRYLAETLDDGTIVLHPAVVITEREKALMDNTTQVARIKRGVADVKAGKGRRLEDVLAELGEDGSCDD